jgi:flagellar biosynthesis protein FlhF
MRIRKFVAADMKDALAEIKRDLGPEALIISARPVRRGLLGNGVEVTAAVDIDDQASSGPTQDGPVAMSAMSGMSALASMATPAPVHAHAAGLSDSDLERIMAPLRTELRSLRSQLRSMEPRNPANEDHGVKQQLQELRTAVALLRTPAEPANDNRLQALSALGAQQRLCAPSTARVVALVGPTGVGKTTTIAKLAARAALVERRSVAIVTLDDYRVGGEDQMRAFADLIGVPLTVCPSERLGAVLSTLSGHERVFIDTAGRSPRDTQAITQLARSFAGLDIEIHLTLPAASSRATIDGCAMRLSALQISRILFTKVDEAEQMEELVRAPARLNWPVSWITTGQRVPEDFEDAGQSRLVDLATVGFNPAAVSVAA